MTSHLDSLQWVDFCDIAAARHTIRRNALRRVPKAIVRSLALSIVVLVGLLLVAWVWLKPSEYPEQWIAPSTLWAILYFFTSPWPLVYIFADYHDQHTLLDHITRRLHAGERISMPPQGVLKVPILISEDQS